MVLTACPPTQTLMPQNSSTPTVSCKLAGLACTSTRLQFVSITVPQLFCARTKCFFFLTLTTGLPARALRQGAGRQACLQAGQVACMSRASTASQSRAPCGSPGKSIYERSQARAVRGGILHAARRRARAGQ